MKISILASLSILVSGAIFLAGCQGGAESGSINPRIADHYKTFANLSASQPQSALKALNEAEKADKENAYTHYLRASLQAQEGDFASAMETIKAGNQLPKVIHYVSEAPPGDPMQSLGKVRQLAFTIGKAESLGKDFEQYCKSIRIAGARIAKLEPLSSLGVLTGTGLVRRAYQEEIKVLTKTGGKAKALKQQKELDEFKTWTDTLLKDLAEQVKDLTREAGAAAGLTEAELADYAMGKPLSDKGKQKKADEAKLKIYEAEINLLKERVATMPNVGQNPGQ